MKGRVGSAQISFESIWNFELQSYVSKFADYLGMLFINLQKKSMQQTKYIWSSQLLMFLL